MLGLGWTEMLVIGVMALIFIGPKDLPVVMNRIGKIVGQVKRMGNEFQREINKTTGLDEVRNLRNSITSPLKQTADEIRREFNAMTPTGAKPSGVIRPANPAVESVVDEIKAKAGMTATAAPLTADAAAKAAGFKPAGPAPTASSATFGKPPATADKKVPVKAAKAPAKAKAAPTSPVVASDLAPIGADAPSVATPAVVKAAPKKAAAAKPSTDKPATPKPAAAKKAPSSKAVAAKPAAAKSVSASEPVKTAPAKKRALAKPKTASEATSKTTTPETATTTADKAGDN